MAYTVLARKYRPQTFSDLVGQEHVTRTLGNALKSDRVAHAFLFTGARGVGKTTTARLLAKALNCDNGPTPEPCGTCDPCKDIAAGTDLDVLEIDGASNNSVEDVRRLQKTLPLRPARDRYKVVIVDEVHMLSTGAFNAFLKTLEEPPSHVKFIFATTEIHKVPVTIRSRCQRHDFRLMAQGVVAGRVREILASEGIEADDAGVAIVAREAAGSMRDALTVLDQLLAFSSEGLRGEEVARGLGIADRGRVLEVAQQLLSHDPRGCLLSIHAIGEQGLDVLHFARQLLEMMRDLVVLRVAGDAEGLIDMVEDERKAALELASAHEPGELERAFAGVSQLVEEVGQASNPRVAMEMGLVRMADRPALLPLGELVARLKGLEGRLSDGPGPGPGRGSGPGPGRGGPQRGSGGGGGEPTRRPREAQAQPPPRNEETPRDASPGATPAAPPSTPASSTQSSASTPSTPSTPAEPPRQPRTPEPVEAESTEEAAPLVDRPPPPKPAAQEGPIPEPWLQIVERLKHSQPALGAILEHGIASEVSPQKLVLHFPEGSFFGRQAKAPAAQRQIVAEAEAVLGSRPALDINFGEPKPGTATVAEVEKQQRDAQHEKRLDAARNHPAVVQAIEVFPEARDFVDVRIKTD